MATFNLEQVAAFHPKKNDFIRRAVERVRAERFGQLDMPTDFTLNVGLVIGYNQQIQHCSKHPTKFVYSIERMRWENVEPVEWMSTLNCKAIAVGYWHPGHEKELMRVSLTTETTLCPGDRLTIPAGHLIMDSQTGFHFPREDYVIQEEPDDIDWQERFVGALNYKPRKRKKK